MSDAYVQVKMRADHGKYRRGEVARLPPWEAENLLKQRIASKIEHAQTKAEQAAAQRAAIADDAVLDEAVRRGFMPEPTEADRKKMLRAARKAGRG